jgi:hypothetical protein
MSNSTYLLLRGGYTFESSAGVALYLPTLANQPAVGPSLISAAIHCGIPYLFLAHSESALTGSRRVTPF